MQETKFKQTEVEWKPLGEICDIKGRIGFRGYTRKDIVEESKGAISLSPSNIINNVLSFEDCTYISWDKYNESPEIMAEVGDIVFTKTASVGKTALIRTLPKETTINPQLVLLKKILCNAEYLSYLLQDKRFQVKVMAETGIGCVPNVSQTVLENIEIPLPPIAEQKLIGSALTAADNLIASLDKQIAKTRNLKQAAMQHLLSSLPNHSPLKPLGGVYRRLHGTPITAGTMQKIANPAGDIIIYAGGKTIVNAFEKDIPDANITKVPSVLIQSRGVVDALYCDKPFTFKNEMWAYTCDNTDSLKFLCYYLRHNIEYFRTAAARSGMPQISLEDTETYLIPVPPIEEQERIASILTAMDRQIATLEKKRSKYEMVKQGMMQQLLTGTIRLI